MRYTPSIVALDYADKLVVEFLVDLFNNNPLYIVFVSHLVRI